MENSFAHHGVLGMKWGVRRYQNKDGTLTAAGKRRQQGEPPVKGKKKVTALTDIDPTSEGVDKFIYLVPKTGSDEDDVYDEYMVLDGKVEHVGNTKVDLSDYAKKSELPEMATDAEIDAMLTEVFGAASTPEVDPQA